jgi:hypothetical protein
VSGGERLEDLSRHDPQQGGEVPVPSTARVWDGVRVTRSASFYLGPRKPRFQAGFWGDVVTAAAAGVLDETHWVELKQAVPATSRSANLELAKDLASLSVDGGVLIIGIADARGAAGEVIGTGLEGLESRIAQVANGRISPALPVTIDLLDKPEEPGVGVVLVAVPASEGAPHMVDGHYWGRDAHGKRVLSDDEVRRLLGDRQARAVGFAERLREAPDRLDPPGLGERGRLYLLLEPAAAAQEPLSELLDGKHVLQVAAAALSFRPAWQPSFDSIGVWVPHPDGIAAASMATGTASANPQDFLLILLADDGTVHISAPAVRQYGRAPDAPDVVSTAQVLETVHGAVAIAGHLATAHTGYQGPWRIGVLVTRLRGLVPNQALNLGFQRFAPYPSDEYRNARQTSTREMVEETSVVVERLVKGLLRGLGVEHRILPYRDPSEIALRCQ